MSVSDTETSKLFEEVDKLQSDPQAKEAFLAALKSSTAGFGLLGPDATVTQNSATLGSSGDDTTKSGGSSSNVPLIAGIAGGVVVVAAVAVFLVTRSRSSSVGDEQTVGDKPMIGRRSSIAMSKSHSFRSNEVESREEHDLDMAVFANPSYGDRYGALPEDKPAQAVYANDGVDDGVDYAIVNGRPVKTVFASYDDPVSVSDGLYADVQDNDRATHAEANADNADNDGGYLNVTDGDPEDDEDEEGAGLVADEMGIDVEESMCENEDHYEDQDQDAEVSDDEIGLQGEERQEDLDVHHDGSDDDNYSDDE
jgi:hypothetical protein